MIICYFCMMGSLFLLTITCLQGFFQFMIFKATHQQFALFSTIFYMFSQTLIMFYFIGSGTAIKKEVQLLGIHSNIYEKVKKSKMLLFPHLTLNMLIIGTAFILIGAVDIGSVSSLYQISLFLIGYIHFLYTVKIQHLGFKENIEVISEIADLGKLNSATN